MHTIYTYILYARECVRIYSGISKRIASLDHPRVESAHITLAHKLEVDRVRVHITPFLVLREMVALDQDHI